MTSLPPIRFPVSRPSLGVPERTRVLTALAEGQLSQGRQVEQFERAFAEWIGVREAVATMNGTVALHLALAALGVGPGDEVIVPALTFVATANAAAYCGARVVLVDVDPATWCLDPAEVLKVVLRRTRAIIPVHLYGHLADVRAIENAAARRAFPASPIAVIEDAAQSHGASLNGVRTGSLSRCGTFSFYGNKILTCGEGGMVTTDDAALAQTLRLLRGQGMDSRRRYYHPVVGYNYRMTELQGAVGLAQVEHADEHVAARRGIAEGYQAALAESGVEWQTPLAGSRPVWGLFTVLLPRGVDRAWVMQELRAQGIDTRPAFVPLCQLPMYAEAHTDRRFPVATDIGRRGLSLPTYRGLHVNDIGEIAAALRRCLE